MGSINVQGVGTFLVPDSFSSMSPDAQAAAVSEMVASVHGAGSPTPAGNGDALTPAATTAQGDPDVSMTGQPGAGATLRSDLYGLLPGSLKRGIAYAETGAADTLDVASAHGLAGDIRGVTDNTAAAQPSTTGGPRVVRSPRPVPSCCRGHPRGRAGGPAVRLAGDRRCGPDGRRGDPRDGRRGHRGAHPVGRHREGPCSQRWASTAGRGGPCGRPWCRRWARRGRDCWVRQRRVVRTGRRDPVCRSPCGDPPRCSRRGRCGRPGARLDGGDASRRPDRSSLGRRPRPSSEPPQGPRCPAPGRLAIGSTAPQRPTPRRPRRRRSIRWMPPARPMW